MNPMVIDIHAHYPRAERDFPERLVELLPQAGIDKICLFSAGETFGHASNEEIMAAARKFPAQILRIYIRDVTNEPAESERYQKAFRDVLRARWQIFRAPDELSSDLSLPKAP